MTHYRSIHYLRAIAAMMVVWFHIHFSVPGMRAEAATYDWMRRGVDIFFVISGFVMVSSVRDRASTPVEFFAQRCRRVVPLYWLMTILMLSLKGWNWHALATSLFFVPVYDASIGWFEPTLPPGWTLNLEMFFYVLFAVSLAFPPKWRLPIMIALLGSLVVIGHAAPTVSLLRFYGCPMVLEFLAGVAIAQFRWSLPAVMLPTGFLLLALGVSMPYFDYDYAIPLLAATIVAAALSLEGRLPKFEILDLLGRASYAIYLVHLFGIVMALTLWQMIAPGNTGFAMFAFVVAIMLGVIVHVVIEDPLSAWVKLLHLPLIDRRRLRRLET